jgi:hypothetical protein
MEIQGEIQKMMGPRETMVLFIDSQKHQETTIDTLAITNERIIIGRHNALTEKLEFTTHNYPDITGVGVEKGFMRSIVRLRLKNSGVSMDSIRLPPKIAEQALGIIKDKVCRNPSPL